MTTLIDRIIKKIGESPREDYRPDKEKQLRQILEAELTAVKGVDELIYCNNCFMKYVSKQIFGGVCNKKGKCCHCKKDGDYCITAIKQTPVNDSKPKEVEISKIKEIALDYLGVDGGHHKQYALEQIIKIIDPKRVNKNEEKGIPA